MLQLKLAMDQRGKMVGEHSPKPTHFNTTP